MGKFQKGVSQFFSVFAFTIVQTIKGRKYVKLTISVLLLFLGITIFGSLYLAYHEYKEKEEYRTSIEKVWVTEGMLNKDFLRFNPNKTYQKIQVKEIPNLQEISIEELGKRDILIEIQENKGSYEIQGMLTEDSEISKEDAKVFTEIVKACFYDKLAEENGISQENLKLLNKGCTGEVYTAGESEHGVEWVIKVSFPVFVGVFIYLLLVVYGQTIMIEVSREKNSRLMETMLVYVYPEALVSGKILGIALLGILQVALWIGGIVFGLVVGVLFGSALYPEESDGYREIIKVTREYTMGTNLTSALRIGILVIGLGILFYCFWAGIGGSLIEKPEHAGNIQQLIQFPLMFCFVVSYFAVYSEKKELLGFLRYIPFTAPFVLPGELMVGTASLNTGWIVSGILLVSVILLGIVAGKVYRYRIVHYGKGE